jgi:hypothetical protein
VVAHAGMLLVPVGEGGLAGEDLCGGGKRSGKEGCESEASAGHGYSRD